MQSELAGVGGAVAVQRVDGDIEESLRPHRISLQLTESVRELTSPPLLPVGAKGLQFGRQFRPARGAETAGDLAGEVAPGVDLRNQVRVASDLSRRARLCEDLLELAR